ncbi:MAG: hypothetical protein KGL39_35275, partial [Patescibacteria group bacterium]|nr:hypothetical protein [Patescibacteria group bacterium]
RGENVSGGAAAISLSDITHSTAYSAKKTTRDVPGYVGDECQITLTTTGTDWQAIIRKLVLNATP